MPEGRAGSRRTATRFTPGDLLKELQPFPAHAVFEIHEPGGVAARSRKACDKAGANRIADDREHDRYAAGRLQQCPHSQRAIGQNGLGCKRDQLRRVPANLDAISAGPAGVDAHVLADAPARLSQPLQKCSEAGLKFRVVRRGGQQYADAPCALALLSAHGERPTNGRRRYTCNCLDEIAPFHVRPWSQGGIVSTQTSTLIGAELVSRESP